MRSGNGVQGKRILLIVGGGIAAYKSLELTRRLKERGASVRAILTKGGAEFVTPLSFSVLTEERAFTDLFDLQDEAEIGHIRLSREADLIVVAPATADLLAKMAHGLASDLATAVLLATDKRVLLAPAMNVRMWEHPATQRNLATLRADGVHFVGPEEGEMACGEFGLGRMAEPAAILQAITGLLGGRDTPSATVRPLKAQGAPQTGASLSGRHVLITSGPTQEPIDPVRYIANRSSGKQGHALARAAKALGANVTLVSGPVALPDPDGVRVIKVDTAHEMLAAVLSALPADLAICAAAVADWRASDEAPQKLKKPPEGSETTLKLTLNPDILATISRAGPARPRLVIGFAAETESLIENAKSKLKRKGADWIVANDVWPGTGAMGGDRTQVHLVTERGVEDWPPMSKDEMAERLLARAAEALQALRPAAE
ncbi:bifunctional phosphopantothenoylcysteine decarboxylase/phosphopantothenate--cysteine ligase CoaBC [Methyloceanibacter sp.]|uniref:bifunctional phosphopantothenoylcysteine decarboxylase/phosphopantothenate--cysteine ligase CoaBC n=1 Tax=Methyloceanibacter sp. TaxID=1965321 RepID=UPI002D714E90|nr:bifunctional phosphopantothenoylcysteine decarboxylase/phosphopantothenate--cysteine ligase CoaBC [Methyloceanibacter sp.]HZP08415.1 bifunctional phosphopantothenoylcysteine decarboxylase/phosphopantothenate--cysteine ligase CoaBC [Methyloceanibacter sp.]